MKRDPISAEARNRDHSWRLMGGVDRQGDAIRLGNCILFLLDKFPTTKRGDPGG